MLRAEGHNSAHFLHCIKSGSEKVMIFFSWNMTVFVKFMHSDTIAEAFCVITSKMLHCVYQLKRILHEREETKGNGR